MGNTRVFDGSNPHRVREQRNRGASYLTNTEAEEISYGNADDDKHIPDVVTITIFEPQDERSKTVTYWKIGLAQLAMDGQVLTYTDSTASGHTAGGAVGDRFSAAEYAGELSTSTDRELVAIAVALEQHPSKAKLAICSDSTAALSVTKNLSNGHPTRSGIEQRITTPTRWAFCGCGTT